MVLGRHCERVRFNKVRLSKRRKGAKSEKMECVPASSAYMLANGQQEAWRPRALAPSALARVGAGTTATATATAACNVQRVIGSALSSEVCGRGRGAEGRRESRRKRKRKHEAVAVANGQGAGAQEDGKKAGPSVTRSEREMRFINRRRRFSESLSLKRGHRVTGTRISAAKRAWENGHIYELLST